MRSECKVSREQHHNSPAKKTRIRSKTWCGTKTGTLDQGKEPKAKYPASKEPCPRKGEPKATSDQRKDQQFDTGYAHTTKSRPSKEQFQRPLPHVRGDEIARAIANQVENEVQVKPSKLIGMWQFNRKRGNHMMLDNKSSQK